MADLAVFTEVEEQWQEEFLRSELDEPELELEFTEAEVDSVSGSIKDEAILLSPFIRSNCSAEELAEWPQLQLIATRSTGYDHIDLGYCRQHNVAVSNVPTYGDNTVAEHTFALILALSRKIHQVIVRSQRGEYGFHDIQGFDLRGKTLGVIGTGHIGKHVIKMARGFGMDVLAYDPQTDKFVAELLDFEYVDLPELLSESHIVSLHCPLNDATHHLLDEEQLEQCRSDAIIVNTARGALINTEALLEALENEKLGGAALDVVEGEELILEEPNIIDKDFPRSQLNQLVQNNQLLKMDNVIFTPHLAYNSREAVERILETTAHNLCCFLRGKPTNLVS